MRADLRARALACTSPAPRCRPSVSPYQQLPASFTSSSSAYLRRCKVLEQKACAQTPHYFGALLISVFPHHGIVAHQIGVGLFGVLQSRFLAEKMTFVF